MVPIRFDVFNHYFFKSFLHPFLSYFTSGDPTYMIYIGPLEVVPKLTDALFIFVFSACFILVSSCCCVFTFITLSSAGTSLPLSPSGAVLSQMLWSSSLEDLFGGSFSPSYLLNVLRFPSALSCIGNIVVKTTSTDPTICIISGSVLIGCFLSSLWDIFS